MNESVMCAKCGAECKRKGFAAGYAELPNVGKICYQCSAEIERQWMLACGRSVLYLTPIIKVGPIGRGYGTHLAGYDITDWPGKLRFKVAFWKEGRHNIAGSRVDVWFIGPDDKVWHGACFGHNTQLCHVKRTKYATLDAVR